MSRYLVLDGGDGVGKSTQARALVEYLRAQGRSVVHLREPGSTVFGEHLRTLLLDPALGDVDATTELLAFSAARSAMLREQVAPELRAGRTVVVERCCVSTLVYQCLASDEPAPTALWQSVSRALHERLLIDGLFLLDLDAKTATERREGVADRIEARKAEFHARVREGFLRFAESPELQAGIVKSVHRIDAGQALDAVTRDVLAASASVELRQRESGGASDV